MRLLMTFSRKARKQRSIMCSETDPSKFQIAIDIRGCYPNMCLTSKYPFAKFSSKDSVEPWKGDVNGTGWYYVDTKQYFPFHGTDWYCAEMIEYGLEKDLIGKEEILHQLTARHHINPSILESIIKDIATTLKDVVLPSSKPICPPKGIICLDDTDICSTTVSEPKPTRLSKLVTNAMIGCYNKMGQKSFNHTVTDSPNEASWYLKMHPENEITVHETEDETMRFYEIRQLQDVSMAHESRRPIYNQILDLSNIALHKTCEQIKAKGGKIIMIKTDCVQAEFPSFQSLESLGFDTTKYKLEQTRTFNKDKVDKSDPKTEKTIYCSSPWVQLEGGKLDECIEDVKTFKAQHQGKILTDDETEILKAKQAKMLDEMVERIKPLKGCNIQGMAGTGKSYLIRHLKKHLSREKGDVLVMAPTNKAALIVRGRTIHRSLGLAIDAIKINRKILKVFKRVEWIIVDESSMVSEKLYHFLDIIRMKCDVKLIMVGDFEQLDPVEPDELEPFEYSESDLLKGMCNHNRLELTVNQRSDDIMWNLNKRVLKDEDISSEFPRFDTKNEYWNDWRHLSYRNKTRKFVNKTAMEHHIEGHPDLPIFEVKAFDRCKQSQNLRLQQGMPVIARCSNKPYGISNNEEFTIKSIDEKYTVLVSADRAKMAATVEDGVDEVAPTEVTIFTPKLTEVMTVAFCITIHKSQGSTFDRPYVIWDFKNNPDCNERLGRKLRYVAISRTSKKENIYLA